MASKQTVTLFILGGFAGFLLLRLILQMRRKRALSMPLPVDWLTLIETNIPPYRRLSDVLKQQLHGYIREFL